MSHNHDHLTSGHGTIGPLRLMGKTCVSTVLSLFAGAVLVLGNGCSPYPIYNTSAPPPPRDGDVVTEDSPPAGRPIAQVSGDDAKVYEGDLVEPRVDPAIFKRVADGYMGTPYLMGGEGHDGIDCSNLIRMIYREYDGTRLPASTRALFQLPEEVPPDALAPGDLVFFSFDGSAASHVGAYLGSGKFVHASESSGVIASSLRDPHYGDRYVGARRVR